MLGGKIMKETYSIKEILRKLEATEDGILLIPDSDVAIVDERDLEVFELPESLETSKVISFNVYIHNTQEGYVIDYQTGNSRVQN